VAYLVGWLITGCCGLPAVLTLHALGLRLACHLSDVEVPGFLKSVGIGAFTLVAVLVVQVLGTVYLGVGPFGGPDEPVFLLARIVIVGGVAAGLALLYVPALDIRLGQAVRVVLFQSIYVMLFVIGWLLLAMLR
jgi:hypothetical protein